MSLRLVRHTQTHASGRAQALLGDSPTMTLIGDPSTPDVCCTVRLARRGDVWVGVVSDRTAFVDRVRMGLVPRFLFGDVAVVTVSGVARTRVLGKAESMVGELAALVTALAGPWGAADGVVIEVVPDDLVVDDGDIPAVVPRT